MSHPEHFFILANSFWADLWEAIRGWFLAFDWWKFVFNLLLAALICLMGLLVITLISARRDDARFRNELDYGASTVRIYKIDGPRNTVRFFNLSDMRHHRTVTIDDFYGSFPTSEQRRIREWITAILDGKEADQFLETDVYFHRTGRLAPSFLKIAKADPTKGIIHLESYLLQNRTPIRSLGIKNLSTEGDFSEFLKANGSLNGMTFCFAVMPRILDKNTSGDEDFKQAVTHGLSLRFKNALSPYIQGNQKLIQASDNEFIVANFDMSDTTQAVNFALRVVNGANAALAKERKRGEPEYVVKAGIVPNRDLLGDGDAIILEARRTAGSAFEANSPIAFYRKGTTDYSDNEIITYRTEVERIIYEKKIIYSFRPIYWVSKKRVYGYLGRATPINCSFSSIDELKNYAVRAQDDKNLFAAIAKNLVPRFVSERDLKSQKLFYPARVDELGAIAPFFSHLKGAKEANLTFLFEEGDLTAGLSSGGLEAILGSFREIKDAGFAIAVLLGGKSLLLDPQLLDAMDAFLVDFFASGDEANMDIKIRSQLHALVEKLLKYHKPIIADNLMSWNAIELVVGSGIDFISSDVFAPYGEMIAPVSEKNEARLLAMAERK